MGKESEREYKNTYDICTHTQGFPGGSDSKEYPCNAGGPGSILGWEDPLEKGMAAHSSILAWGISWTAEPGGVQSMDNMNTVPAPLPPQPRGLSLPGAR